jgi:hypothetical protein
MIVGRSNAPIHLLFADSSQSDIVAAGGISVGGNAHQSEDSCADGNGGGDRRRGGSSQTANRWTGRQRGSCLLGFLIAWLVIPAISNDIVRLPRRLGAPLIRRSARAEARPFRRPLS